MVQITTEIVKASDQATASDFSYIYAESSAKAFVRVTKEIAQELFGLKLTTTSVAAALDNVTKNGRLYIASANVATVGGPSAATGDIIVETLYYDSNNAIQMAYQIDAADRVWYRRKSTTWQTWREVYNANSILGTVSQSAGVPTGSVIERGTNANGEYVRFADGTQICTHNVGNLASNSATGGGFSTSAASTWTFPAAFVGTTGLSVAGMANAIGRWLSFDNISATVVDVRHNSWVSNGSGFSTRVIAIGRWF